MGAEDRRKIRTLIERLKAEAYRFDFFQAVRLLERFYVGAEADQSETPHLPPGHDAPPSQEVVRFRALPTLSFPPGAVIRLEQGRPPRGRAAESDHNRQQPLEMTVGFSGLTGPQGALPEHYTSLVIERIRQNDYTLRDFLDLLNHRHLSFYYRAWEKFHFFVGYEKSRRRNEDGRNDDFTQALFSLMGLGEPTLRGRLQIDDEFLLYYVGLFSRPGRSAIGLRSMLHDFLKLPVQVEEFIEHRVRLSREDRWALPDKRRPQGRNNQLGGSMVLGERTWLSQSRFRLRIGPMPYERFRQFWPDGDHILPLCQLTRLYVGPEFDFEIQLVVQRDEVPAAKFDCRHPAESPRLGWNSWLRGRKQTKDADDVIFLVSRI